MANVYVGDSKALVFPVMCDGHLKLEYDDTNISTSKGNFWNHTGNFVLEAINGGVKGIFGRMKSWYQGHF